MKKLLIHALVLFAAGLVACSKSEDVVTTAPSVSVEVVSRSLTSVTIKFIPSENTSMYKFALGTEFDRENFMNGDIAGTMTEVSNNAVEYTFTGLDNSMYYVVYAVAYDSNNANGPVTSRGVQTMDTDFVVTKKYVSDDSAGFLIECSADYYTFSCALGTADDKDAFLDNLMSGITTFDEEFIRQMNYYDLDNDTDYVFYCIGYDRAGRESQLFEIPFKTYSQSDSFPNFDIEIGTKRSDFYCQSYVVTPNDLCSKVELFVTEPNSEFDLETLYYTYASRIDYAFTVISSSLAVGIPGSPIDVLWGNTTKEAGAKHRAYLVTYDLNGALAHIKRFDTSTPAVDPTLPEPKASDIKLSFDKEAMEAMNSITAAVTVSYDAASTGIMGFYIDLIDAKFFDEQLGGDKGALYDAFFTNITSRGFFYDTPQITVTYTDDGSLFYDPDLEWYFGVISVNANGLQGAATEITLSEKFSLPKAE